jgi:signal peptidase I
MRAETIFRGAPTIRAVAQTISIANQIFQLLVVTILAVAGYYVISHYVLQAVRVDGVSMVPTLHNADQYYLKRWVLLMRPPQRGDIVVIKDPTDGGFAVKRIIATAGESVFLNKNGLVYVNGSKLSEPYLTPGTPTHTCAKADEEMISCGDGKFFVMGDNRDNSFDSRYYGPIPRQNILGVINP